MRSDNLLLQKESYLTTIAYAQGGNQRGVRVDSTPKILNTLKFLDILHLSSLVFLFRE